MERRILQISDNTRGAYLLPQNPFVTDRGYRRLLNWPSEEDLDERDARIEAAQRLFRRNGSPEAHNSSVDLDDQSGGEAALIQQPVVMLLKDGGVVREMDRHHLYVSAYTARYGYDRQILVKEAPSTPRTRRAVKHEMNMCQRFSGICCGFVSVEKCYGGNFLRIALKFVPDSLINVLLERDNEKNWTIPSGVFQCMKELERQQRLMRDTRLTNFRVVKRELRHQSYFSDLIVEHFFLCFSTY